MRWGRLGSRVTASGQACVFDSGSLLNVPFEEQAVARSGSVFDQMAARCAAVPSCARSYRPAADLATIAARLHAHPVTVTLPAGGGRTTSATITASIFLQFIQSYLAAPQTAVLLPADLHALTRGKWQTVLGERGVAADYTAQASSVAMQWLTIYCSDAWSTSSQAFARQHASDLFGPVLSADAARWRAACGYWPHEPGASGITRSTAPIAFINGTADLYDPPVNVAAATRTMPHALLVSVPGAGHWVLNSPRAGCLLADTTAFIRAGVPASRTAWAACTRTLPRGQPPFPASHP
jgi:pimeloyl-ACP methyl ester carboxylesterase